MCGVFGVIALTEARPEQVLELFSLLAAGNQHRGQEWHGIAYSDGKHLGIEKRPGLVASSFNNNALMDELLGSQMIMGQTRYSTQGDSTSRNAQPHYVRMPSGTFALGSNGDIPKYDEARGIVERRGSELISQNDAEVLLHWILFYAQNNPAEFPRGIAELMHGLPASYSAWLATRDRLHLFRDPWANRPYFWMRAGKFLFFSSEDCALYTVLAQMAGQDECEEEIEVNQILPGEIITVELHGGEVECKQAVKPKPQLACCAFEGVYFSRPDSHLFVPKGDNRLVYKIQVVCGADGDCALKYSFRDGVRQHGSFRYDCGVELISERPLPSEDACIIAIPSSGNKAAEGCSDGCGLKLRGGLIKSPYVARTFITPGRQQRMTLAVLKYTPQQALLQAFDHIGAVDDSVIYGTTSEAIIRMMRTAGAKHIHFRVASPPVYHTCPSGMDFCSKGELTAAKLGSEKAIEEQSGADSFAFLSLDGLKKVIGPENVPHFCFHCWDGVERIC